MNIILIVFVYSLEWWFDKNIITHHRTLIHFFFAQNKIFVFSSTQDKITRLYARARYHMLLANRKEKKYDIQLRGTFLAFMHTRSVFFTTNQFSDVNYILFFSFSSPFLISRSFLTPSFSSDDHHQKKKRKLYIRRLCTLTLMSCL